ncbi:hypothetical protein KV205_10250 [Streptomyces sp. SKN60]|nr:hypothetical protein [Streptomyces sp. SKN60]MCX2180909.1 hypothetical protein [Streptomyces sp. SKN60]
MAVSIMAAGTAKARTRDQKAGSEEAECEEAGSEEAESEEAGKRVAPFAM